VLVTIDHIPATEPCSAAYCVDSVRYVRELEAGLNKALALLQTSCIDVNDADIKYRKAPERIELCAIVTRFVMPPVSKEAGS
jgi:hypothetical protein